MDRVLNVDYVICPICKKEYKNLTSHINNIHKINGEQFYKLFPNEKIICDKYIEKLKNTKSLTKEYRSKKAKIDFLSGKRKIPISNGRGIGGYRKDIGHYCRSMWEANLARILIFKNIKYKYELKFPLYDNTGKLLYTYVPDFYLCDEDIFIEVKGLWMKNAKDKIKLFEKQYNTKVYILDGKKYSELESKYKYKIPLWECSKYNIKTNKTKDHIKHNNKNCPVCNKKYNKLLLHFTLESKKDIKHKLFLEDQIKKINSLFYELNINKNTDFSKYEIIFNNYRTIKTIWYNSFSISERNERQNKINSCNKKQLIKNENLVICPVCKKHLTRLYTHFKNNNDIKHSDFLINQKNICIKLFNNLNIGPKTNLKEYGLYFNYNFVKKVWKENFNKSIIDERTRKLFLQNNNRKKVNNDRK